MNFLSNFFIKQNITNIFVLGLFTRIVILIFYGNPHFGDTQTYKQIGEEIFNLQKVTTSIHMPGYGIYIYLNNFLLNSEYGFFFTDILLSSVTIIFVYWLSKKIFNDELVSKISAIIFALYPFSIFYSVSGLSETLYVFLLLSAILNFYNKKYLFGIIFIVLSIYVKSISFYIGPILLFTFLIVQHKSNLKNFCNFSVLYILILAILMSPWWMHNYKKYNAFVPTDLSFGYHLYAGNNSMNKTGGGIGGVDVNHQLILGLDKHDYFKSNQLFKNEAYNFIIENPSKFLNLSLKRLLRFWRIYPYAEEYNTFFYKIISIFSFGFVLSFFFIFLFFYSRNFFLSIIPLLVIILFFTFVYTVTISSIRYRFPIEPILIIFASYAIRRLLFSR